ncbi:MULTISPECIES: hypothetical protein [Leuconostoc]|uniref:hypothetical protein n=1 Tax=Leuconostoc TaxID=1243 RepID=UPI000CF9E61A|nr:MULTISPECIES: hypothetical protein [Leuconostoc]MCT4376839.1 hypothetical protein [Leuconostoc suionicum]SPE67836.1 hypothetical protein LEM9217_01447 [Leuconostoc mesenteroides]
MSLALDITVFDSAKLVIKGTYKLFSYDIQMDALSNATSSFTIDKNTNIMTGDYVAVRPNNSATLMYYGQIITVDVDDSSNLMTLSANYIWNLLNGDIIVGSKSGNSYESHILKLINNYINSNIGTNLLNKGLTNSTNTAFQVTSSDGISTSNFIDYLIRGFKLHNTVFEVTGIGQDISNEVPFYYPKIDFHQATDTWNFKNDVYDFNNWVVSDSRNLRNYNNELWIVDQASTDMESPTVLARYWLTKDGSISKSLTDSVAKPTQVQIYLFDKTATDNPTYESIAQSNLSANTYSHSIQFSAQLGNNFLPLEKVKLGLQSNIYYDNTQYKSVLTAYSIDSSSEVVNLTFGNLRFGRNDLFSTTN